MTPFMQLLLTIAIPAVIALLGAVAAILAVAVNWQTALALLVSAAVFPVLLLVIWLITLRPRLFVYNTLEVHWILWVALAAVIGILWWLYIYVTRGSLLGPGWDALLIASGLLAANTVIAWRFPQLWIALTPTKVAEEQMTLAVRYLGKVEDHVGRGNPYPDGYPDATFAIEIVKVYAHLQKTITQILLNRVDVRGMPRQQQWVANVPHMLWPLAVVDSQFGQRLNPVGAYCQITVSDKSTLNLYASDWAEKGSTWFASGQRYRVTVYFSDMTWADAITRIP